jgi:adenosylcobinamide-GDP ribazoletransferase
VTGGRGRAGGIAGTAGGVRLAISTLTIVRAGAPRVDAKAAGTAMASAPLVGLGVGAAAAGVGQLAYWWTQAPLISATVAIATLAALTRALHLDGLADTADGLGSGKPAGEALDIMKRSDIGPFGVVALILVLAVQIASLSAAYGIHRGAVAVIVAAMAGRLAVTVACSRPFPSARASGLGAWVARSVRVRTTVAVGVAVAVVSGLLGLIVDRQTAVLAVAAVLFGVAGALVLLGRCIRRFGGITGDVLGALVETSAAVALLVLAARP